MIESLKRSHNIYKKTVRKLEKLNTDRTGSRNLTKAETEAFRMTNAELIRLHDWAYSGFRKAVKAESMEIQPREVRDKAYSETIKTQSWADPKKLAQLEKELGKKICSDPDLITKELEQKIYSDPDLGFNLNVY